MRSPSSVQEVGIMQVPSSKKPSLVVGIEHRTDLKPLTEEEIRFEIDMCIGCDRCMRACPVPMSSLVSATARISAPSTRQRMT